MPNLDVSGALVPDGREWLEAYDQSSSSGLVCKVCHCLVPRMQEHAEAHQAWHAERDR